MPMERGASYVKGLGANLDAIQGRDVVLRGFTTEPRTIRGNDTTLVNMDISELNSKGDADTEIKEYHAFSTPLAQRLSDIPDDAFPVLVKFVKSKTGSGFSVWSIE